MIARVRHLSVEPYFRTSSSYSYIPTVHFSFSIIEPLRGTPAGDVVVVEYSVFGRVSTKTQAIEEAKEWIASARDEWWNEREAIIFLDDLRLGGGGVSEISTGAQYSFADHFICNDHGIYGSCFTWRIANNDFYSNWVWLPFIEQDASPDVPDSERMFRVVVDSYDHYANRVANASLAEIKAILKAYRLEEDGRWQYADRYRSLWEAKGSDSYSFVFSAVNAYTWDVHHYERTLIPAQRIFVRNGEVVEAFFLEDVDLGDKVLPAGSRIDFEEMGDSPTIETLVWDLAEGWARGSQYYTDVSFDYEFGYPTAITTEEADGSEMLFFASEYTPLDN